MTRMLVLDFAVSTIIKARDLKKKKNLIKANDGAFLLLNSWRVKPIRHIHQILSTKFLRDIRICSQYCVETRPNGLAAGQEGGAPTQVKEKCSFHPIPGDRLCRGRRVQAWIFLA